MIDLQIAVTKLGKLAAYNEFNVPVQFADLWKEQIVVLVFVRHFG